MNQKNFFYMLILLLIILLLSNSIFFKHDKSIFSKFLFFILYLRSNIVLLVLIVCITFEDSNFEPLKSIYTYILSMKLLLIFFGDRIHYIHPYITMEEPSPHRFTNIPLRSASSSSIDNEELRTLIQDKNKCKDEMAQAHEAVQDIVKAVRLDKMLPDKSQNKSMRDIMAHYKEYFDEESGNTKQEGLKQIYEELSKDFNLKLEKYKKAKKRFDEFNISSQYICPILISGNINLILPFFKYILPYITLLLSIISLVISIGFTFNYNILLYIPDFIWNIYNYVIDFIKYEIVLTLPTLIWSYYTLCKKYKRYFNISINITYKIYYFLKNYYIIIYIYYIKNIYKFFKNISPLMVISWLSVAFISLIIFLFMFTPEELLSTATSLALYI